MELFVGFAPSAVVEALLDYSWPGNVRELKNVVERAIYQHGRDPYPIESLVFNPFQPAWITGAKILLKKLAMSQPTAILHLKALFLCLSVRKRWQNNKISNYSNQALKQSKYNQKQAAELLGLTYNQLRGMVRKYAIVGQANDK